MTEFYSIEKDGVKTVVDEYQFRSIYEPKGWSIVSAVGGAHETVKTSKDEAKIRNKARSKQRAENKQFDDHLIKET